MKAYLKYGGFSQLIDIPRALPEIALAKPINVASANVTDTNKLIFMYRHTTTVYGEKVAIYDFWGES